MNTASPVSPSDRGQAAESQALRYLLDQGLLLVARNFKAARGEIDLIMRDGETLVFLEVRARAATRFARAAETVGSVKQKRIVHTAQWFLSQRGWHDRYACRFDVIAIDGDELSWIQAAFMAA